MTYQLAANSSYSSGVSYALASGSLPSGVSLSTSGGLSGTFAATSGATDPYASYVTCFMPLIGSQGSTYFVDQTGLSTVATVGQPIISTAVLSTGALALNGSSALQLTASSASTFSFGANDFTIECSVYLTTVQAAYFVASLATTTTYSWWVYYNTGYLVFSYSNNGTTFTQTTYAWTPVANTWYQIAVVRKGSNVYAFVNGSQIGSTYTTSLGTLFAVSTAQIGYNQSSAASYLVGSVDAVRITNGFGRYTANYAVYAATYSAATDPYSSYVTSLIPFTGSSGSTTFVDQTALSTFATVGSPSIAISPISNGALYLNGSSALKLTSSGSTFSFGANDFTMEASVYLTSLSGTIAPLGSWATTSTWSWLWQITSTTFALSYSTTGSAVAATPSVTWSPALYTWYQIAVVRKGSSLYYFVNGTQIGTTQTISGSLFAVSTMQVGYDQQTATQYVNGYIEGVRITNGFGRYTTSYTPSSFVAINPVSFQTINPATYLFAIGASDTYSTVARTFTMPATTLSWSTAANLGTYVQQTAVSIPLITTASSGTVATSYTVTSGTLPTGLALVSSNIIGTLPAISSNTTYNFTVTAFAGANAVAGNPLAMTLNAVTTATSDAYAGNVTLLGHFDNGSFADVMGHSATLSGSPTITANEFGLYNESLYLNGSSYLFYTPTNSEFQLGSGNFTIECSVYPMALPSNTNISLVCATAASNLSYGVFIYNAALYVAWSTNGTSYGTSIALGGTIALNAWSTLAVSRSGSTLYGYVNGVLVGTSTTLGASTLFAGTSPITLGAGVGAYFTGYMDEVRVTVGIARYTGSSYTYTTAVPFPNPPAALAISGSTTYGGLPAANAGSITYGGAYTTNAAPGFPIAIIGGSPFTLTVTPAYPSQPITSYTLASGSLPAGLSLSSTTGVSGTTTNPASTTSYTFAITATDGYSTYSKTVLAEVLHGVAPTWVTPSGSLLTQVQGENVYYQLSATANALTLTTSAAATLAGTTLTFSSTTGVIVGMTIVGTLIPSKTTVSAVTSTTVTTSQVIPPIPTSTTLNFTPSPVTYAVTTGALPSGLTLSTTGLISGMLGYVTSNTTTNFTVTASAGLSTAQSFSITTLASATVDPYIANVVFESYFIGNAGTSGGTLFYDTAGHTVSTVVGSPTLSTVTSITGGASLYLNGSSSIAFAPFGTEFQFGANNFTIEFSACFSTTTGTQTMLIFGSTAGVSLQIAWLPSSLVVDYTTNGTTGIANLTIAFTPVINTWYTIAYVRSGANTYLFVNGNIIGTSTTSMGTLYNSTFPLVLGADTYPASEYFTGYLDAVRITNGIARYTGNYTPSTALFQEVYFPPLTAVSLPSSLGSLGTQVQGSTFGVYITANSPTRCPTRCHPAPCRPVSRSMRPLVSSAACCRPWPATPRRISPSPRPMAPARRCNPTRSPRRRAASPIAHRLWWLRKCISTACTGRPVSSMSRAIRSHSARRPPACRSSSTMCGCAAAVRCFSMAWRALSTSARPQRATAR